MKNLKKRLIKIAVVLTILIGCASLQSFKGSTDSYIADNINSIQWGGNLLTYQDDLQTTDSSNSDSIEITEEEGFTNWLKNLFASVFGF